MPEKLYTLEEVAKYLNVSETEIQSLVDDGVIPAYKIGGSFIRFRKDQLDAIRDEIAARVEKDKPEAYSSILHDNQIELPPLKETVIDKIKDFFYFNDYYLVSFFIIAALLYVIYKM